MSGAGAALGGRHRDRDSELALVFLREQTWARGPATRLHADLPCGSPLPGMGTTSVRVASDVRSAPRSGPVCPGAPRPRPHGLLDCGLSEPGWVPFGLGVPPVPSESRSTRFLCCRARPVQPPGVASEGARC